MLAGRTLGLVAALGAVVGAYSAVSDLMLGPLIGTPFLLLVNLGNAAVPWIVAAFAAGATTISLPAGAVSGVGTLLIAVATYYMIQALGFGEVRLGVLVLWIAVAIFVGPVFGAIGSAWRHRRRPELAVGVLSGALMAEAAFVLNQLGGFAGLDFGVGRTQLVLLLFAAAAVVPPLLLRGRLVAVAYGTGMAVAVVGLVVLWAVSTVLDALVRM